MWTVNVIWERNDYFSIPFPIQYSIFGYAVDLMAEQPNTGNRAPIYLGSLTTMFGPHNPALSLPNGPLRGTLSHFEGEGLPWQLVDWECGCQPLIVSQPSAISTVPSAPMPQTAGQSLIAVGSSGSS